MAVDGPVRLPEPAKLAEAGELLHVARTRRGLTLNDVHRELRIPLAVLGDLEEGRTDHHLAPVYIRGFLRTYARLVKVDVEDALTTTKATQDIVTARTQPARRRALGTTAHGPVAATAIALMLVTGMAAAVAHRGSGASASASGARSSAAVRTSGIATAGPLITTTTASPPPTSAPIAAPAPIDAVRQNGSAAQYVVGGGNLNLAFEATRDCWMHVTTAGATLREGVLSAGQRDALVATPPIVIRLGDGAAVTIRVGDHPLAAVGAAGKPIDLQLSA